MINEIKFRIWDKKLHQFVEDAEGFHVMGEVTAFGIIEEYLRKNQVDCIPTLLRWNDLELLQYIGRNDMNKKDIYIGDILYYTGSYDGSLNFYLEVKKDYSILNSLTEMIDRGGKFINVGNKFLNPELLKLCH